MKWSICFLAALSCVLSCKDSGGGHSHGSDTHPPHGEEDGLPGESVSLWTDKAELFMDWEPLIVGRETRFLAHITNLKDKAAFQAVAQGQVVVSLSVDGAQPQSASASEPARPGVFTPTLTPAAAGKCTMTLNLKSAAVSERFDVTPCTVYPDEATARAAMDGSEPLGQVGFLKEQQWSIEFSTAVVRQELVVPSKTINAKILAVPGREAQLTAGTTGRLSLVSPVPTLGTKIKKGQLLARIQPTMSAPGNVGSLRAEVAASQAELAAAEAARARLQPLVASDSIPKRRLDEAIASVSVARARLNASRTRLSSYQASASGGSRPGAGAFQVKAPISGTLVAQSVTEGETVSAGAALFTVIDLARVWVEGRVFEPDVPAFEATQSAWFTVDGRDTVFKIGESTGKLITVGHVLDPRSRTVPVIFEVENPGKVLRIGQFAKLSVATGAEVKSLVIPEAAILQDGNQSIAYVHVSGEAFERRVLVLGARSRGLVEVLHGVLVGERVVTKGAYDIKLAASAGDAPAHGHAH